MRLIFASTCCLLGVALALSGEPLLAKTTIEGGEQVRAQAIVFSPDGKRLAVTTMSREPLLGILKVSDGTFVWKTASAPFSGTGFGLAAFSSDGKKLAVADMVGGIMLLDSENGEPIWRTEQTGQRSWSRRARAIRFANEKHLLVVFESRTELRESSSGKVL